MATKYILVVVDHVFRYALACLTTNKTGKTATDKIFNEFIPGFGFPKQIRHDGDHKSENDLFHHLEQRTGVVCSRASLYHRT